MKLYKTNRIPNETFAQQKIDQYNSWIQNGCCGGSPLTGYFELMPYINETIEFIDETETDEKNRLAQEDEELKLMTDLEHFRFEKVKPKVLEKLSLWIDKTYIQPLYYNLTSEQKTEREQTRLSLLGLLNVTEYMTDTELEALVEGVKPSYI